MKKSQVPDVLVYAVIAIAALIIIAAIALMIYKGGISTITSPPKLKTF